MIKKILTTILCVSLCMILAFEPVMASGVIGKFTITESNANGYTSQPVIATTGNTALIAAGKLTASGTDAQVTQNGVPVKRLVRDTATNFIASSIAPSTNTYLQYTGGNSPENFAIIPADGGYITTLDNADLEPGDDFDITLTDIHVDTSSGSVDSDIFNKTDSLRCYVSAEGYLSAVITNDITQSNTPSSLDVWSGNVPKHGQRLNAFTGTITSVGFWMSDPAAVTGTAYCRIRKASDDSLLETMGSIDLSTIAGAATEYTFDDTTYTGTGIDIRVLLEFDGGDAVNHIHSYYANADTITGTDTYYFGAAWTDTAGADKSIRISMDIVATKACATGEHDLIISADTTNLSLSVDGSATTTALGGVSCPGNANDWIWLSDATLYVYRIQLTQGANDRIDYIPTTYILGTVMPNTEVPGSYEGAFTWGSNPAGVAAVFTAGELTVGTYAATTVRSTSATLNGTLFGFGTYTTAVSFFEYGTSTDYGSNTATYTLYAAQPFSASISNLKPNTTYHFRAVVQFYDTLPIYGDDASFSTGLVDMSSTTITVQRGRVFADYDDTGDMLFVAEIINVYTNYYGVVQPRDYFSIQLVDTDGTTVLTSVPLQQWGDRPACIYVNATVASGLTWGSAYTIRCVLNTDTSEKGSYILTADDWKGSDLVKLDDWLLETARSMGTYDYETYITPTTDGNLQINDDGGGYFTVGIQSISQKRPHMFVVSKTRQAYAQGTDTDVYTAAHDWSTQVGATIKSDVEDVGDLFSITGDQVLVFGLAAIILMLSAGTGKLLGVAICCVPLVLLGNEFGFIPIEFTGVVLVVMPVFFFVRQMFIKTT